MQGFEVFEPIGLDGFGIHSENYALRIGVHPMRQAKISEKRFYRQLEMLGNGFAWEERLETYDPEYYRWTQWIFLQLFKRGLAYREKAPVNWCPNCKTVLADEQVVKKLVSKSEERADRTQDRSEESEYVQVCERCDTAVIKKDLEQWFFRITKYAQRLLDNLDKIDWSERVKIAQRNWIGRSEGALVKFPIKSADDFIEVFTTRPDTIFGATYLVLSPEHKFIRKYGHCFKNYDEIKKYVEAAASRLEEERISDTREKTGVKIKGIAAVNPATGQEIPIWVADYVLAYVGTGAIMAVPAHDERDYEFAKKFGLPIKKVVIPKLLISMPRNIEDIAAGARTDLRIESECWTGPGELINSAEFSGMDSQKAKDKIVEFLGAKRTVQYRLRDWLISRQRYWGPPIPLIFCQNCKELIDKYKHRETSYKLLRKFSRGELENPGWIAVPEKELPVSLPYIKNFRPTGTEKSPLAGVPKFYKVSCPKCGSSARRETDVSDTFLDSAWYYLRYPSVKEKNRPWNKAITKKWLPVDMYIGGAEHSVLHLLYVRFLAMALQDLGLIHFGEPFPKFRAHGLIIKDGAKMSKSKGNIVNPDEYIQAYGADALRMYLMFLGPFEQGGDFRDGGIRGITRFLERVWKFCEGCISADKKKRIYKKDIQLDRLLQRTIKKVTEDIESLHYNTAISALMVLLNEFEKKDSAVSSKEIEVFLKLLAPFAPHITEELWQRFKKEDRKETKKNSRAAKFSSIHLETWPKYNSKMVRDETFKLIVQVNGKLRARINAPVGISKNDAKKIALADEKVKKYILKRAPKRVIFVPDRLINFVV